LILLTQKTIQRRKRYEERKDKINALRREDYRIKGEIIRERERQNYKKNRDEILKTLRDRYNNDPEFRQRRLEKNKQYRVSPKGRDTRNMIARRKLKENKTKLIVILGGKVCKKCGYDEDERALQIDHINGGGVKERRKGYTYQVFKKYVDNPELAKKTLQVLCANCNQIKKFENKEL
jgi:hypothetical protein